MKKYEEAIIEIEKFEIMDVITDSVGDDDYEEDENELPGI